MFEDSQIDIEKYFSSEQMSQIIGTDFVKKIKSTINYQSLCLEIADRKILMESLIEIITTTSLVFNENISKIQNFKRGTNNARNFAILIAKKKFWLQAN